MFGDLCVLLRSVTNSLCEISYLYLAMFNIAIHQCTCFILCFQPAEHNFSRKMALSYFFVLLQVPSCGENARNTVPDCDIQY